MYRGNIIGPFDFNLKRFDCNVILDQNQFCTYIHVQEIDKVPLLTQPI